MQSKKKELLEGLQKRPQNEKKKNLSAYIQTANDYVVNRIKSVLHDNLRI